MNINLEHITVKSINEKIELVKQLKIQKKAVILAHHYQSMAIKEVADIIGDSLELSRKATQVASDLIIFCGVHFMAESAKLLSPKKRVYLPNLNAGCPMADMATREWVLEKKKEHPSAAVVSYVNTSAEVKAVSDICCTSSNAVKIVREISSNEIIFVPDQNLGSYVQKLVPSKTIHLWRGFCPTHHRIGAEAVMSMKAKYPEAKILIHPECKPEVVELADVVGSTAQIIKACEESDQTEFVIGTELGVVESLKKQFPSKRFYLLDEAMVCPNMKKTTLDDVINTLVNQTGEIIIEDEIQSSASQAIWAMLERS